MTSIEQLCPPHSRAILLALIKSEPRVEELFLNGIGTRFEEQASKWKHSDANSAPGDSIQHIFDSATQGLVAADKTKLEAALCAALAVDLPTRVIKEDLPDNVKAYYPAEFERLALDLQCTSENSYERRNLLANYTRFLFCLTVPCGAQDLDLRDKIPFSSPILATWREQSLKSLFNYFEVAGWGIWFRPHTNTFRLEEFNETGFDEFYARVAQLLQRRPKVRGLALTSWFYDPALLSISPRLSFLQTRPQERGAHLMKHGSSTHAANFATRTSETRRKLYEEGKYVPTEYSLIWRREDILHWYSNLRG